MLLSFGVKRFASTTNSSPDLFEMFELFLSQIDMALSLREREPKSKARIWKMAALKGTLTNATGIPPFNPPAVWGDSSNTVGVEGTSSLAPGVQGQSKGHAGVWGSSDLIAGVCGSCSGDSSSNVGAGVIGYNGSQVPLGDPTVLVDEINTQCGVLGLSDNSDGIYGLSFGQGNGVTGLSTPGLGVGGGSTQSFGVGGKSEQSAGVAGVSAQSVGVYGNGATHAVTGIITDGEVGQQDAIAGYFSNLQIDPEVKPRQWQITYLKAAEFAGNVDIDGDLFVAGTKGFKIDHPLDPARKTLKHSAVESPDMKNLYDGVVQLDRKGSAAVRLPKWFCALNRDFRYQLTALEAAAPSLHIAEEITDNEFTIAGGVPGGRVSWTVTGIRQDPWANAYRMKVEEPKGPKDRGRFVAPHLYKEAADKEPRSVLKRAMAEGLALQERFANELTLKVPPPAHRGPGRSPKRGAGKRKSQPATKTRAGR